MRITIAVMAGAHAGPLAAQQVTRTGAAEDRVDDRIDRLLAAGDYLLIAGDTLIPQGAVVPRSVLVLDATFTLEGVVEGDLVAVDANVFVRPTARVAGDVVNAGGGLYRSALARIDGTVVDQPSADYRVARARGGYRIEAQRRVERLRLAGFKGFLPPTYDRVDALRLRWGAEYELPDADEIEPRARGWIGYLSGRGALNGGAEIAARRGRTEFAAGVEEVTATNDAWIRGELRNSLSFLINGNDYRNYYEASRLYAGLGRDFGREPSAWRASLRAQLEDAGSLGAGDPWTLVGGDQRPNPAIDDGAIASVSLGSDGRWVGSRSAVEWDGGLELAGTAAGGDASFGRFHLWGEWAMDALADHVVEVEWFLQALLPGTASLPRQRWYILGGSGTLPTFEIGEFRGDRVAFVESEYIVPLPESLRLPILGIPDLHLIHAVGMAWTEAIDRDFEQNVGLRLQFFGPYLRVMTNPADPLDEVDFDIGISWPFDGDYPWRRSR